MDPDSYDDDFDNDNEMDDETPTSQQELPADLRRAAKQGKKAAAEAEALRKENALLRAGVDLESPLGALFSKGYDGEVTTEAIKNAWAAISGNPAATEVPAADDPEISDDERKSTSERQALAANSPADVPVTPDPRVEATTIAKNIIDQGGTREDALAASFNALVEGAVSGDKRVVIDMWNS